MAVDCMLLQSVLVFVKVPVTWVLHVLLRWLDVDGLCLGRRRRRRRWREKIGMVILRHGRQAKLGLRNRNPGNRLLLRLGDRHRWLHRRP